MPLQDPFTWNHFSIGEELSSRHVVSLDWSPPGVAKHRRCALAVLTSNHTLSIWECIGRPELVSDWKRALIVNNVFQDHFLKSNNPDGVGAVADSERLKQLQRIRAFAWSPTLRDVAASDPLIANTTRGVQYIAVSNECGDVLILEITSPYNVLAPSDEWTASVVQTFRVEEDAALQTPLFACLPSYTQPRQPYADQLAWSPWVEDVYGLPASFLSFTTLKAIYHKEMKAERRDNEIQLDLQPTYVHAPESLGVLPRGPLRWAPKPNASGELFLVAFTEDSIACFTTNIRLRPAVNTTCQVRRLDGNWDEYSGIINGIYRDVQQGADRVCAGLTFTRNVNGSLAVHLISHFSSPTAQTTVLPLPFDHATASESSSWQRELLAEQARFSDERDLNGNVQSKTTGIAASPFGETVALCSSMHPTDQVEYVIGADQFSRLILGQELDVTADDMLSENGGISNAHGRPHDRSPY